MKVGYKNYVVLAEQLSSISQNVNLTYGTEKDWFLHMRTYNAPQKYDSPFGKPETKVVIDKTRVGGAVVAFHRRNCLPTKNLKAEYLEFC